ncbi:MAG: polysaccharide biosynthesis protein, partial [Rhodoglobus sp.]
MAQRRALIVGKGAAGKALAEDVSSHGGVVVGFLDDSLTGDDVLGTLADASRVVAEHGVQVIYFAIPSVDAKTVREFMTSIDTDDVEIAIIPRTYSILARETVRIDDLTDVDVLDLVGREPVKHDVLAARGFISGKTVLVTGAAGSIGSRLLRQVLDLDPALVIGVDWWENGMFFLGEDLKEYDRLRLHIGDIRSDQAMAAIFDQYRPDVVF